MNLINMVKKFINVRELDIDLIDGINPFREGFDVASKALDTPLLKQIQSAMVAQRIQMTEDEARTLWPRIKRFREAEGREPNPHAADPLEKRMAEALAYIRSQESRADALRRRGVSACPVRPSTTSSTNPTSSACSMSG